MQPQFDAKLTSKDGKMTLFIRGPFELEDGFGFELKMVPVIEMASGRRYGRARRLRMKLMDATQTRESELAIYPELLTRGSTSEPNRWIDVTRGSDE